MPTTEALGNSIRTRFKEQVQEEQDSDLYVLYDNAPEESDQTGHDEQPDAEIWCRCSIREGETFQVSCGAVGSRRWRTVGVIIVQVFGVLYKGDKQVRELADSIVTAFRGVTADSVVYKTASPQTIGREGPWWRMNVNVSFHADSIS